MSDFSDRGAFVTGGASGIGLAMGKALARQGAKVMLADIEEGPLEEAVEELGAGNAAVDGVICDVTDRDAVFNAAEETVKRFGKVHYLMNNAGVGGGGPMDEVTQGDWDWVIDVDLHGVFYGIQAFVPLIKRHGEGGHIVNTASMAGMIPVPNFGPYTAAKYAVVGMSENLRLELEPFAIGVSVLCPGFVRTNVGSSRRTRHERYGKKAEAAEDAIEEANAAIETGIDPDIVGERVLECIRENQMFAFTHPEFRALVARRYETITAGFDSAERSAALEQVDPGLKKINEERVAEVVAGRGS